MSAGDALAQVGALLGWGIGALLGWGIVCLVRWWLERRRSRLELWTLYCWDCDWIEKHTTPANWPHEVRFAAAIRHVETNPLHEVRGRRVTR